MNIKNRIGNRNYHSKLPIIVFQINLNSILESEKFKETSIVIYITFTFSHLQLMMGVFWHLLGTHKDFLRKFPDLTANRHILVVTPTMNNIRICRTHIFGH